MQKHNPKHLSRIVFTNNGEVKATFNPHTGVMTGDPLAPVTKEPETSTGKTVKTPEPELVN